MSRRQVPRRSRRIVAALCAGCVAFGPTTSAAADTSSDPTDPLGPTIAQLEYEVALLQYDVCQLTEAINGHGFCIPPTPPG